VSLCAPSGADVTVSQFAALANSSVREVIRWIAAWRLKGVDGIREERARGRYGKRYVFTSSFVSRWLACEIPSPHE